ncbi:hypothetical protein SAMN04487831_106127 [Pseudobutyrivibrio sp. UC1225]|uniref:hypothetical protein n=1 Tax=Pseudobutyrivibrio sp. UC1225 TaxID=1798185 RepID=UPI0008EAFF70|nr:hypothetical protein [Pseudobutyrivibrio sp. UC1225]SFO03603.1 hypothetical protein SAMN04487831_106127 [Pseudobutyrivibrio sp. UC1225]
MNQINWVSFEYYNQDSRGVKFKFEDLCRQLFQREFLSENLKKTYLNSNPNNPGLETEPVYDGKTDRYVGFQAKYFEGSTKYDQILKSAKEIVKYYAGKIDCVYLFCNKSLNNSAKTLIETKRLLTNGNIEMVIITDSAILDLVRKNPDLGRYYFGNHHLNLEWFRNQAELQYEILGERFNHEFNVATAYEKYISLFVKDSAGICCINNKKTDLLEHIKDLKCNTYGHEAYLSALIDEVKNLRDIDNETIEESYDWEQIVKENLSQFTSRLEDELKLLEEQQRDTQKIQALIALPSFLTVNDIEKELFEKQILILMGEAGMGKSQLLANKTAELLSQNREALLVLAGLFYTNDPINSQIMANLNLDYSFSELIDLLEVIGEKNSCVVPVFIDALNETWHRKLWQSGISNVIKIIEQTNWVKLVISYRPEYEKELLPTSIIKRIDVEDIPVVYHRGFIENGLEAVQDFLKYYNIPFSPTDYFSYELTNPLFLTLYCKTYQDGNASLPVLYKRLIRQTNQKLIGSCKEFVEKGFGESDDVLSPFVIEYASKIVSTGVRSLTKSELLEFNYWKAYGVTPAIFISALQRERFLHSAQTWHGEDIYFFSYDQMNDYYPAEYIFNKTGKNELKPYLVDNFLGVMDGKISNPQNIDGFVYICALYAKKYGEECIDIIDLISDENSRVQVFSKYVKSLQWREDKTVDAKTVVNLLKRYKCYISDLFEMLIGNSIKVGNPLNALFLHKLLLGYNLSKRDSIWTIYINGMEISENNKLGQLVLMYNRGEALALDDERQLKLLLLLFGWILTSSNRRLRDYTSKALVEILKDNFSLCQWILMKFESVDDPYVISRLYGIVYGVCYKATDREGYKELAEYIYETIFNCEMVYPDILLRDYARQIIELFLEENKDYIGRIDCRKIRPPYNSMPIQQIDWIRKDSEGKCIARLYHSMCFDGMGFYGDFGRYVYQRAIHRFKGVDDRMVFNYSMHYIINDIGFSAELFEEFDGNLEYHNRHETIKTERIGKKYQWITMYNVLARLTDHYQMKTYWDDEPMEYDGPWQIGVRDFEPTLNALKLRQMKLPELNGLPSILILKDDKNEEWVCLKTFTQIDSGSENHLIQWKWYYAFFMSCEQRKYFENCLQEGESIIRTDITWHAPCYEVFIREFPRGASSSEVIGIEYVDTSDIHGFADIGQICHASSEILWEVGYDGSMEESIGVKVPCSDFVKFHNLKMYEYDGLLCDDIGEVAAIDLSLTQGDNTIAVRKDLLDKYLTKKNLELVWLTDAGEEISNNDYTVTEVSRSEAVLVYDGNKVKGEFKRVR